MEQYINFLKYIMASGVDKEDRTGTGIRSVFGYEMRFDLSDGFPLVTTKKCHTKSIVGELLWMLSGSTNVKDLQKNGITIWDEWADEVGDLGPVYGRQWRAWSTSSGPVDQLSNLLISLKENPESRRHIVNAWNVGDLNKMALPPCHAMMQFYVANSVLSCKLTQRSADAFLGVPFNIASYALLLHMVAQQTDLMPGVFIWSGGDCHVYHNHFEQVAKQVEREPKALPNLLLKQAKDLFSYQISDVVIENYQPHSHIAGKVAV